MRPIVITAVAVMLAAPALAEEPARLRLTHEGKTYVYTVHQTGDHQVIDGRVSPAGPRFRLVVRGNDVSGTSSGVPVSFRIRSAAGAVRGLQVAAR